MIFRRLNVCSGASRDVRQRTATTGKVVGQVDSGFSPVACLFSGKSTVRHRLVAVRLTEVAVPGAVEVAVATLEQIELGVS